MLAETNIDIPLILTLVMLAIILYLSARDARRVEDLVMSVLIMLVLFFAGIAVARVLVPWIMS